MVSLESDDQKKYWEARYQQLETGWDIGKHHPLLPKVIAELRQCVTSLHTGMTLVPGAGHAHCAAFWAQQGYETTAVDFAPTAVALAKKTYGDIPSLHISQADIFSPPFSAGSFDIVFDRAMLCALPPHKRADYLAVAARLLRPNGVFALIAFSNVSREIGPPWPLTLSEMSGLFESEFDLLFAQDFVYEKKKNEQIIFGESISLWMRR